MSNVSSFSRAAALAAFSLVLFTASHANASEPELECGEGNYLLSDPTNPALRPTCINPVLLMLGASFHFPDSNASVSLGLPEDQIDHQAIAKYRREWYDQNGN